MRNALSEVQTAVQSMETPDLQSMKLPKSGFFPLFQVWIRLEWILMKNPVIFGTIVTLFLGCLFGKSKLLMCCLFGLFSGIPLFGTDKKDEKNGQFVEVLPMSKLRELKLAKKWNGATIELIRRIVLVRTRWLRNRIRQVPQIVFLVVFLASEFYRTSQHSDNRSMEFVLFFLPLLCLLFILFDISLRK